MRFALALLAASGCNQIFGLEPTVPLAAGDAAFCSEFTASMTTGRGLAMCYGTAMQVADGPLARVQQL